MSATVAEQLAAWASRQASAPLPAAAEHAARRATLDWLGSAIAGAETAPASAARRALARSPGAPQASVLGTWTQTSALQAAFLNAVASHVLEIDDLHRPSTLHPASAVVATALAVAQRERCTGTELLRAVAIGYEVACRIGEAVNPEHYAFWHPTGTVNTFGAAAAAAALQRLDARATTMALGSAGSMAAGLWQFLPDGAMSKHLHPGHAAQAGILAADLAREGFTGAHRILEGEQGFFEATAGVDRSAVALRNLGQEPLKVEQTSFKLYPCCGHTHTGLDLMTRLAARLAPDQVASVDVFTYRSALQVVDDPAPTTAYEAKFSYPYVLAWTLVHGRLDASAFDPANLADPAVRAVMPRIRLHHDAALDERYPGTYPVRIEIRTRAGERLTDALDDAAGTPENPVSDADLETKLRNLAGEEAAAWAIAFVASFGDTALTGDLSGPP